MASILVPFVLGRALAGSVGVPDEAGKNVVALTMMALGPTPVGVVLARQVALQRVPPPGKPPTTDAPHDAGGGERPVASRRG